MKIRTLEIWAAIVTLLIICFIALYLSSSAKDREPGPRRIISPQLKTSILAEPPGSTERIRASRLISGHPPHAWRSRRNDTPPFIFVFSLVSESWIEHIRFFNSGNEDRLPGIGAREVEVEFSMEGPDSGYYRVGLFSLEKGEEPQNIEIPRSAAKWVRLTIHSNHGHPEFTELSEFEAWGNFNFHTLLLMSYFIWIVGAAVVLAAFGWHQHLARRENLSLRDALRLPTFRKPAARGAALIAAGVLASAAGESARVPVLAAMGTIGGVLALLLYFKSEILRSGRDLV